MSRMKERSDGSMTLFTLMNFQSRWVQSEKDAVGNMVVHHLHFIDDILYALLLIPVSALSNAF